MIKVYCNGTRIQCLRQGELTAGMVGAPIEFDFSEEWNGLGKTAVFRCDGERDVILGADKMYVVPHEILTTPGMDVEVGVYAVKEDGTTWPSPTPFCRIGRLEEGADPSGDESYPPTPDVSQQVMSAASTALQAAAEAQEIAAEVQRRADNGEFDGAPGYTPVKGKDYFDGKDGNDYVLTEADKVEIAEIAADLVDVPEGGGSADLTGYATEEWVKKGYQPKGNYLTEVPAGYAKTEDIPTKPSDIGAQPAGNYATKSEIPTVPTKLSAFTNDAGFVTEDALEDLGGKAYVQNTQPANMEEGEFWYNPDEEPEGDAPGGGIDIPDKLPNPHKLTFSGAVSAEYDGSEAVEVVIPQGGVGSGALELLFEITTTEDVLRIDTGIDLNQYNEIFAYCVTISSDSAKTTHLDWGVADATNREVRVTNGLHNTQMRCFPLHLIRTSGKAMLAEATYGYWDGDVMTTNSSRICHVCDNLNITSNFYCTAYTYGGTMLKAGTVLKVYGR